jgi:hypothetical protein
MVGFYDRAWDRSGSYPAHLPSQTCQDLVLDLSLIYLESYPAHHNRQPLKLMLITVDMTGSPGPRRLIRSRFLK